MSAPRSDFSKMMNRTDAMARRYQERIDRQIKVINGLLNANATLDYGMHQIINEARDIRAARKIAQDTKTAAEATLAVPVDEREGTQSE